MRAQQRAAVEPVRNKWHDEQDPTSGGSEETNRFEVSEGHKLDNVPKDRLSLWRAQDPVISVQDLHVCEVCVAHADDDDGQGLVGGSHDGLARVRHVGHHAVRQDEQNVVPLLGGEAFI